MKESCKIALSLFAGCFLASAMAHAAPVSSSGSDANLAGAGNEVVMDKLTITTNYTPGPERSTWAGFGAALWGIAMIAFRHHH